MEHGPRLRLRFISSLVLRQDGLVVVDEPLRVHRVVAQAFSNLARFLGSVFDLIFVYPVRLLDLMTFQNLLASENANVGTRRSVRLDRPFGRFVTAKTY